MSPRRSMRRNFRETEERQSQPETGRRRIQGDKTEKGGLPRIPEMVGLQGKIKDRWMTELMECLKPNE